MGRNLWAELLAELMSERNRQSPNLSGSSAPEFLSPPRCHRARAATGLEFIHSLGHFIKGKMGFYSVLVLEKEKNCFKK